MDIMIKSLNTIQRFKYNTTGGMKNKLKQIMKLASFLRRTSYSFIRLPSSAAFFDNKSVDSRIVNSSRINVSVILAVTDITGIIKKTN